MTCLQRSSNMAFAYLHLPCKLPQAPSSRLGFPCQLERHRAHTVCYRHPCSPLASRRNVVGRDSLYWSRPASISLVAPSAPEAQAGKLRYRVLELLRLDPRYACGDSSQFAIIHQPPNSPKWIPALSSNHGQHRNLGVQAWLAQQPC